ncbi:ubiquitin protease cofactor [Schizosaccharomyces cryophilus OY26]|uniref:Ubiquitin protease cofactor n=1 Tax=Schizosaccharomyces cryophilus (strain OY26 / ATCC MYA-4695 / CBS 11777 / NBRC 106824 / NRRL Y48691) TaxID=653667 RepID=S9W175_SCHCR|nr:ubiquitin protease cofactor [Schizosaccharomyces cryophilus OY26]EPY53723.1 ubiquitin protease cofactor [Schizosaccharomyces cryophilus OY26]
MTAENTTVLEPVVGKDEIGWMFVQEYYTYLNKEPHRLHCFYTKKSTLVHGEEGEAISLCHGQQEIHNKILDLDFQNCKVLISNVDSLASCNGGIVIQVLGEMSNKGKLSRKFAQTFFLAEQPNGYFVLNDIFRFLREDVEDEEVEETEALEASQVNGTNVPSFTPQENKDESLPFELSKPESENPQTQSVVPSSASPKPANVEVPPPSKPEPLPSAISPPPTQAAFDSSSSMAEAAPKQSSPVASSATAKTPRTWANLIARNTPESKSQAAVVNGPSPQQQHQAPAAKPMNVTSNQQPQNTKQLETSVFVKNIPDEVSEDGLKKALGTFGPVKSVEYARRKGTAYVDFNDHACVEAALSKGSAEIENVVLSIEERRRVVPNKLGKPNDRRGGDNYNAGPRRQYRNRPGRSNGYDGHSRENNVTKKQNI